MKSIILVFIIFALILMTNYQMAQECKFYKNKWYGMYLYGNPKKISTYLYDYNTKELLKGGSAYNEIIKFNQFGNCTLHKLYYNHPPKSENEYSFEYADNLLIKEEEFFDEIHYVTEFNYLSSGLLDSKIRYRLNNKQIFYDGEKYEYVKINNIHKISEIISIREILNDSLILGDTTFMEYDNNARLIKKTYPTNMHDNNFDYNSKTILTYKYDNNITTIIKSYTNTNYSEINYEKKLEN